MDDHPSLQEAWQSTSIGAGRDTPGQLGVIGIALAAVLTAALAQGSWQWFSTYIGLTLLAVIFSFYRLPIWMPGLGSAYMRNLAAFNSASSRRRTTPSSTSTSPSSATRT